MVKKIKFVWGILRISMGFVFLWAFIDKLFGLGFSTTSDKAWLLGGSPTYDYLTIATKGIFASFYQNIAGNPLVDWVFMVGLLLIGISLILGIGIKIASYSGALMMLLMWMAVLPPKNNPFLEYHIIYAIILIAFPIVKANYCFGLGEFWSKTKVIRKFPFLE